MAGNVKLMTSAGGGVVLDTAATTATDVTVKVPVTGVNNGTLVCSDSSGNVGIGTSSPTARVHIYSDNSLITDGPTRNAQVLRVAGSDIGYFGSGSWAIGGGSSSDVALTTAGAYPIRLGTNNTERMRIDSSGNLLVGTTSNFNGKITLKTPTSYTGNAFRSDSDTAASTAWGHFYGTSGNNAASNIIIFGNGNIQNANNSYGAISDIKLKENIVDATPKLDKLCQVRVVNYNLIGDYEQHKQLGVIAQELEEVFPGLIEESPDRDEEGKDLGTTTKSVKYSVFVPMLIKAIQEQQAQIETLTAKVAALEAK